MANVPNVILPILLFLANVSKKPEDVSSIIQILHADNAKMAMYSHKTNALDMHPFMELKPWSPLQLSLTLINF